MQHCKLREGTFMYFAATALLAQLATAPASAAPVATISEDWAAPPPPSRKVIDSAVRETLAEERAKENEVPRRHEADMLRGDRYDTFAARFDEAVVPGCLRPDGLKRQPTSIGPFGVTGLLALPLVLVAKLRGKCN
jgi:hypothetical protein